MNSNFGNLFLSLQALIAGLQDNTSKKYFPFVDQDLGQLEAHNGDNRPPVSWPCVLIDIEQFTFKPLGENVQEGIGTICLRLGFPPFSSAANLVPDIYKSKALYYYDLEQVLHQAIQGASPSFVVNSADVLADVFGHYQRISAMTERRNDLIRVRELKYTLTIDDYSTESGLTLTPAAINLTDQVLT